MSLCCPPGRGCNCSEREEPCVLELCRQAIDDPHAALVVERWNELRHTRSASRGERRFRRRAYERARDRALPVLLMRSERRPRAPAARRRSRAAAREPAQLTAERGPMTRVEALLRHYRNAARRWSASAGVRGRERAEVRGREPPTARTSLGAQSAASGGRLIVRQVAAADAAARIALGLSCQRTAAPSLGGVVMRSAKTRGEPGEHLARSLFAGWMSEWVLHARLPLPRASARETARDAGREDCFPAVSRG
jgi:hypothetical protein